MLYSTFEVKVVHWFFDIHFPLTKLLHDLLTFLTAFPMYFFGNLY